MKSRADEILRDPEMAVEVPWNDIALRSGLVPRDYSENHCECGV
jgi:hypothetical protein